MTRRGGGGGDDDDDGDGRCANVPVPVVNRVSAGTLRHLPRTTRWRVQLGLLDLPPAPGTANANSDGDTSKLSDRDPLVERTDPGASSPAAGDPLSVRGNGDGGGGGGPTDHRRTTSFDGGRSPAAAAASTVVVTEDEIYECSASKLARQRDRFDRLARDHMWRNSPLDLIEQEKKEKDPEKKQKPKPPSPKAPSPAPVVDDPLSAFVREREEAERAEAAAAAAAEAEDATDGRGEAGGEGTHNWEERRSYSQWTGFYSNREVIDLINKDLHRLSPRLVLPPLPPRSKKRSPSRTSSAGALSSFASSSEDEDDLLDDDELLGRDFRKLAGPAWERRREERLRLLSDVLFLYSMEHPDVGYRQGMHEVLAHVVLALEMDMGVGGTDENGGRRGGGGGGEDAGEEFVVVPRLSRASSSASSSTSPRAGAAAAPHDLRMDAYLLFEAWMGHLKPAYMDEHASARNGGAGNAAAIGDRVLDLLRLESPQVHSVVSDIGTRMGAPPQLYLVGWMRLMFGRVFADVTGTLDMWDCLLDLLADPPRWSDEDRGPGEGEGGRRRDDDDDDDPPRLLSLVDILECAACGMILLQAPSLLSGSGGNGGDDRDDDDDGGVGGGVSSTMRMHDRLSLLMNYPPLSDVGELRDLTVIAAGDLAERRRSQRRQRQGRRRGGHPAPPAVPGEISVVEARVAASAAAAAAMSSGAHRRPRTTPTPPPRGAVVVRCRDDLRPRSSVGHGVSHPPQPQPPQRQRQQGRIVAGAGGGQQHRQQQNRDGGVALSSRVGVALDRTVVSCRGLLAKAEDRISQEIANMEGRIKIQHEDGNAVPAAPHGSSVSVPFHRGGNFDSVVDPLTTSSLGDGGVSSSATSPHYQTATSATAAPTPREEDEDGQQQQQWRQDELQRSKLRERLLGISNGMDAGLREIRDHLLLPNGRGSTIGLRENGAGSSDAPQHAPSSPRDDDGQRRTAGGNVDSSSTDAFQTIPLLPESKQRRPPGEGVLEALRRLEGLQRELASLGAEL